MLQHIRNNVQGTIAKIIIALIIIPFALFGIDSFFGGSGAQQAAATINGEKVSEIELQQAIALQKRQLLAMMGNSIDPTLLDDNVLRQPALQSLIRQKLLLQTAEEAGLHISSRQLNNSIVSMPQFADGERFSQQRYEQVLRSQGLNSALFKQLLGNEMLIGQVSAGIAGSGFLTPAQMEQAVRLGEQKRTYHYIRVPVQHFSDDISISEDDVAEYYETNKESFKTEEAVQLSYIELRQDAFFEPVDEADLRAEYQREVEAAAKEARRRAAHILISLDGESSREAAEQRVADIRQRLQSGESFEALAKEFSDDAGSAEMGGDLGFTSGDTFPEPFERALAELSEGEVSEAVETDAGLHLIKLVELSTADIAAYEQRRVALEARIQAQRAQPKLIAAVEQLKDLAFNAPDLSGPAEEMGLELQQTDWITPSADNPVLASAEVRQAAFDSELREAGHNSDVFEVGAGHHLVVRPAAYRPQAIKPLADVSASIEEILVNQRATVAAQAKAADLKERLANAEDAEKLAKREGLEWQVAVRSARQDGTVEDAVRQLAFNLPRPTEDAEVVSGAVMLDNGDRVVVQLKAVYDGDSTLIDNARRRELLASALRSQSSLLFGAYFNGVIDSAEVKIIN